MYKNSNFLTDFKWFEAVSKIGKEVNGSFKWNLKIKPLGSAREGIQPGSQLPRFSSRINDGNYINPFTGRAGGVDVGFIFLLSRSFIHKRFLRTKKIRVKM